MKRHVSNTYTIITVLTALCLLSLSVALFSCGPKPAVETPGAPVVATHGMVVSGHPLATKAGVDVLREGGNAVDAAVAVGFALAVTLPSAGNIGGGGFMVIHDAKTGETISLDYREKAPFKAHRDMYLDDNGDPDSDKSQFSYLAVGVPGSVAGMAYALEKYGTISLERAISPAIELADKGFAVDEYLSSSLKSLKKRLEKSPASMKIFYKEGGVPYEAGDTIIQKDLAWSLKQIAKHGPDAFYRGEVGKRIAADMASHGGLITMQDLAAYEPVVRTPVHGTYRGYDIYSMPPPSSGGVHLIQMLNILEGFTLKNWGHNTPETVHVMAECMKYAYADRAEFLGDPDFVKIPVKGLTSKEYAKSIRDKIDPDRATPSATIRPGDPGRYESPNTTHYSVMDRFGNAVSCTTTLNFSYGTGITAEGTGILYNDEMDDFSSKPGTPNGYGLLGNENNAIAPGKRMLSCMTPTIIMKNGRAWVVTGSPGGSRIITTTLQMVLNIIDHGMNVREATDAKRVHHQWMPDELYVERGFSAETAAALKAKGQTVTETGTMGVTQTIMWDGRRFYGAGDKRISSSTAMGY